MKTKDARLLKLDALLERTLEEFASGRRPIPVTQSGVVFTIAFALDSDLVDFLPIVPAFFWELRLTENTQERAREWFGKIGKHEQVLGFLHLGLDAETHQYTAILETKLGNQAWKLVNGTWQANKPDLAGIRIFQNLLH